MLVASSEEILRIYLNKELKNEGYELVIAKDGIEALYLINTINMTEHTFELYLIDTELSKFNYINLIIKIQELKISKPIILMTSDMNLHSGSDIFTFPVMGFLKKPFLKDELLSMMNSVMTGVK